MWNRLDAFVLDAEYKWLFSFLLQYAEKFVTDVRMRAHNAAEAVYYSLPEMPQLPKLPQLPELHNLQQNVLLQMQHVRSTAVASAHDAYAILQVINCLITYERPWVRIQVRSQMTLRIITCKWKKEVMMA